LAGEARWLAASFSVGPSESSSLAARLRHTTGSLVIKARVYKLVAEKGCSHPTCRISFSFSRLTDATARSAVMYLACYERGFRLLCDNDSYFS
jgi:hypothetical protein